MTRIQIVAALALLASTAAQAKSEHRYTMLFSGHVAGQHVTTIADDGRITTDFSYRENGRGPDYKESLRLAPDGTLAEFRISGTSTFGAKVDERFALRGGRAKWSGAVDRGEIAVKGPAIYVPIDSTVETLGITIRALAQAPQQRLAALPAGELSLQKLTDTTLTRGPEQRALTLYALRGADLEPAYVWMNADGSRVFATIYPGFAQLVETGWEAQANELETLQVAAETAAIKARALRLRHALKEPILIRNARIFDAEHAQLGAASDVYIAEGRIAAIAEAGSPAQDAGTVIEAGGRVLLPGLFDMHAHVAPGDLLLNLGAGVTTVRDMGNGNETLAELRGRLGRHEAIGPHVVPAGFIEGKSPYNASNGILVDSLDEAKRAVDWYAQRGFPQIKIYNSFHPEWVRETAAYAHRRGLRVSGHIPAFMKAEDAVKAGYDEIQHINQVLLNFFVTPTTDTRTLARFTLIADNAGSLDLDSARVRDFISLLVEHKTVIDPTLTTFEGQFTQKPGELSPSFGMLAEHLPITLRRGLRKSESELTDAIAPRWRASYAAMLRMVGKLHAAGVPIVAGTDDFAGFTLQRELELYVKAGIAPAEALRIATWNGALYSRQISDRGSIERGKRADLILVDGDPTTNISDIRRVALVLQDGDWYNPAELYGELGITPFTPAVQPQPAVPAGASARLVQQPGAEGGDAARGPYTRSLFAR